MTAEDRPAAPVPPVEESLAVYLAKRLVGDRRFRPGVPEEAKELANQADAVLTLSNFGLTLAAVIDREATPDKRFTFDKEQLLAIGRACLKYTGTVNGAKMPVGFALYEVGSDAPSDADLVRLKALQRFMPGLGKVVITCFYVDARAKTVWSSAPFNGLLRGRPWVEGVVRGPRKADAAIFVPDAALPATPAKPVATIALLAALTVIFGFEQAASVGGKASGPLGVNAGTLFALGGMDAHAVHGSGEWYRLLSAALLHADLFHLLFNGVALFLAGYLLERLVGSAWLLCLFFVGALGGSVMGLLVNPANQVSVGASGAVMGLLAAALILALRIPQGPTRSQMQMHVLQFLIPSLIPLATERHGGHIDYAAHFGGALVGLAAGFALLRMWPRDHEAPRFSGGAKLFAGGAVAAFALSLFLARGHYAAYAEEVAFASEDLLAPDGKIPKDIEVAKRDVDEWGGGHPHDPRVHLFRALRFLDANDAPNAEQELRAALSERRILETAFPNRKLETTLTAVLCELLLQEGKGDEAKREAQALCKGAGGAPPEELSRLGVCD